MAEDLEQVAGGAWPLFCALGQLCQLTGHMPFGTSHTTPVAGWGFKMGPVEHWRSSQSTGWFCLEDIHLSVPVIVTTGRPA